MRKLIGFAILLVLTLSFQNCAPFIGEGESMSAMGSEYTPLLANNPFQCQPTAEPEETPLRRLSKREYLNTVFDLFHGAISREEIQDNTLQIPSEEVSTEFKSFFNFPSILHVDGYLGASSSIAELLVSEENILRSGTGVTCLSLGSSISNDCFDQLNHVFFKRVFRRPLSVDEKNKLISLYSSMGDHKEGLKAILQYGLLNPAFLYRVEINGSPIDGNENLLQLNNFELASKLSYFLTGSMPDSELFSAAEEGVLKNPGVLLEQATRLITSSPYVKEMAKDFFYQWLQIDPSSTNYSSSFLEGINVNSNFQDIATQEFNDFIVKTIWEDKGDFSDLILSRKAYFSDPRLEKIYETKGNPNASVQLPEDKRGGVLTRVRYLMTGTDSSLPMHRGAGFQRNFLCYDLQQPPAFPDDPTALMPPDVDPDLTTRDRFHQKTDQAACVGCHIKINPPAFAFEAFDSIGRFRLQEKIFNEQGELENTLPIDTSGQIGFQSGSQFSFTNPIDLITQSMDTPDPGACFVKKWVSYSAGRLASEQDNCVLSKMYDSANLGNKGILDMLMNLVQSEHFRLKKVGAVD